MSRAYSIHVGVSNSDGHAGPLGTALGCDEAARQLSDVATRLGYVEPLLLTNGDAKYRKVRRSLEDLAGTVGKHELLLITLAGHGRELSGPGHGPDAHDQAIVLYDDYLVDDEIYDILSHIDRHANVVIIAEGCHTGSISTRFLFGDVASRVMPPDCNGRKRALICPDVLLLAATSSTSVASAAQNKGVPLFTRALLDNLDGSRDYYDLKKRIDRDLKDKAPECVLNEELLHKDAKLPNMKPLHP